MRGLLWPSFEATWPMKPDADALTHTKALVDDSIGSVKAMQGNQVVAEQCGEVLGDLEAYSIMLRAAAEDPSLDSSEAHRRSMQ